MRSLVRAERVSGVKLAIQERHQGFKVNKYEWICTPDPQDSAFFAYLILLGGRLAECPLHHVVRIGGYGSIAP